MWLEFWSELHIEAFMKNSMNDHCFFRQEFSKNFDDIFPLLLVIREQMTAEFRLEKQLCLTVITSG